MVRGWDLSGGSRPRRQRRPCTGFKCRRRRPRRGVNAGGAPQATSRSNPRRRRRASLRPMRRDSREGPQRADTLKPAERKQAAAGRCTKKRVSRRRWAVYASRHTPINMSSSNSAPWRRPSRSPRRGLRRVAKWPSQAAHPPRVIFFR